MKLSSETKAALERIETISEAEDFLRTFGSHYPSDIHHYGGIVHFSCEVRASDCYSVSEIESNAEREFAASLFWQGLGIVFKANASYKNKSEYQQKQQKAGRQSIWSLLGTKFENQAELIKNAWMGLTKDIKFKDIQDLRSYYHNIDGELARKNMLQLADLRIQQKRKCSAEDNAVQDAQETEEENEMESLTPVISVKTDLTKQPKLNLPNRENVSNPTETLLIVLVT
ncbi:hypothetical protein QYM36_013623 [Artemia franciscana]|uniref:Uncharacterized protein n=1 Tax=Artemia franciscana TaxID=6661 RepID=A0AA88L298_ARTSF|nr:hypothetical protein QYM36_013623 [Artemia franciscana]